MAEFVEKSSCFLIGKVEFRPLRRTPPGLFRKVYLGQLFKLIDEVWKICFVNTQLCDQDLRQHLLMLGYFGKLTSELDYVR